MHQFEIDQLNFPLKIDYYSGAQGNFLQLMLALNTSPEMLDLDHLFDETGACHTIYDITKQPRWATQVGTTHFSQMNLPLNPDDRVLEIHVPKNYYLIVLINYLLRAPDHPFDIFTPHVASTQKLDRDPRKLQNWQKQLQHFFGPGPDYELWQWRCLFYFAFLHPDVERNQFNHKGAKMIMEFDCFFDLKQFCDILKKISNFFGLTWQYNPATEKVWRDYMDRNQGLAAKLRCDHISNAILAGRSVDLDDLDVVSQAWLTYRCFGKSPHLAIPWMKNFPKTSDQPAISFGDQLLSESVWLEIATR
jgi:hypothetical protein